MRIILAKEKTNGEQVDAERAYMRLMSTLKMRLNERGHFARFSLREQGEMWHTITLTLPSNVSPTFNIEYIPERNSVIFWHGGKEKEWDIATVAENCGAVADEIVDMIEAVLHEMAQGLVADAPPPPVSAATIVSIIASILNLAGEFASKKLGLRVKLIPAWETLDWFPNTGYHHTSGGITLYITFYVMVLDTQQDKVLKVSAPTKLSIISSPDQQYYMVAITPPQPADRMETVITQIPTRERIAEIIADAIAALYKEWGLEEGVTVFHRYAGYDAFCIAMANAIHTEIINALRYLISYPELFFRWAGRTHIFHFTTEDNNKLYLYLTISPLVGADKTAEKGISIIVALSTIESLPKNIHPRVLPSPKAVTVTGASIYARFGDISVRPPSLRQISKYTHLGQVQLQEPVGMNDLQKAMRLGEILGKTVARFIANIAPHFVVNLAKVITSIS